MRINVNIKESNYISDSYAAFLSFTYNEILISYIKSFRERSWSKETLEWEIPIRSLADLFEDFSDYEFRITGRYVDLTPKKAEVPDGFTFKTNPFNHQSEGLLFGLSHEKWLLGDEQGLGKTKQAIDIAVAKKIEKNYSHCLIICGVNGLKWNWKKEIEIHSNESGYILGERQKKKGTIYIGSNKDKLEDIKNLPGDYFIITNVESIRNNDILNALVKLIEDNTINMIVVDEMHKMKASNSQQGKAILKLQPEYRLALTGTPLMNSPLDLYIILKWLGYEKHAYYTFKNHYAITGGYGGYQVIGYRHLEDLQDQLDAIMLRRLKSDVLDLPDKLYIDEYIDMLPKQKIIYNEVTAEIKMNIDAIEISPNPLVEMIRMRQATGWTGILSTEVACSAKMDRLLELVQEITDNDRKVVIFSNWTQITKVVLTLLSENYRVAYCTGEVNDVGRKQAIQYFQEYDDCQIIVGTFGALGTGVTLTAADTVICVDHPWTMAAYQQAIDRTHRIGQQNNVTIYNLMCKDTIDEKIWNIVQRKGIISDTMIDHLDIPENKKELVRYLLS